jgi:hypothetical protein
MTQRIKHALRKPRLVAPPWAVHFHVDAVTGGSTPCYDPRCQLPPLSTGGGRRA